MPVGRNKRLGGGWNRPLDSILGNWQLSGILNLRGGFPLTIAALDALLFFVLPTDVVARFPTYREGVFLVDVIGRGYPKDYFEAHSERGFDIKPTETPRTDQIHYLDDIQYNVWSNAIGCFDKPVGQLKGRFWYMAGDSIAWGHAKFEDLMGNALQLGDLRPGDVLAAASHRQRLEHGPHFVRLQQPFEALLSDEHPAVVHRIHQSEPAQLKQGLAHDTLTNVKLFRQLTLHEFFAGLDLTGADHVLETIPDTMPDHATGWGVGGQGFPPSDRSNHK